MMTNSSSKDIPEKVTNLLKILAPESDWPIPLEIVKRAVEQTVSDWIKEVDDELTRLIKEWESSVDDDKTLYTLGLRRAQDIVRGHDLKGTP
jgi:hypothetical protein